ncbi:MAG: hypothetical protein IJ581_02295 [Paludibacteraceae bacterium]|nr:hypothetical protein [Paludibacteraceae bacterium]
MTHTTKHPYIIPQTALVRFDTGFLMQEDWADPLSSSGSHSEAGKSAPSHRSPAPAYRALIRH